MKKLIALSLLTASMMFGCSDPKTNFTPLTQTQTEAANDFVSGSIAIDLKDELTAADIAEMSKEYGFTIRDSSPLAHNLGNLEIADVNPEQENVILDKLAHDPRVEEVEPTMLVHAYFEPNDPLYKDQWGMKAVQATNAWNYTTGKGVVVSIIDTGVEESHPDLQGVSFIPGYNFAEGNTNTRDRQSHGTHVCSTVAEVSNNDIGGIGLAPHVQIMPVKALSDSGSGTMEGVASSIIFATDHGADVINMSLGSSQKSAVVAKAVKYAYEHHVFVAVAAGNDSRPASGSPATDYGAFAVSATDQQGNLARFSSYGKDIKIAAPGVDILQSTVDRNGQGTPVYASYSGTSMASPHIAGLAALAYSQGITNPDKALQVMQTNAVQKSDASKFGAGIMDAGTTTRSIYLNHLLFRGGFLLLFGFVLLTLLKKNGKSLLEGRNRTVAILTAVFSSVGLFWFLPFTGLLPHMGSFRWLGDLLSRPFSEWEMAVSVSFHKYLPMASALPAFLLIALGNHKPILRTLAGGLALGTAAYLGQVCYANEIQFILGPLAMRLWCLVNIAACLWVAKNTLAKI